ncbi:MAG: cyclohexanecarboxylate-CoA ligase [Frankiales bacterium]|nr:cyclohexanecarboxylate-CoA ligase [Frankiales bacterium]
MSWLLSPTTVWDLVEQRADATPDRDAILDEHGVVLTFAGLRARALETAAALADLGIGPGSRVAWQLPTRVSTVVTMLALARLGALQAPLLTLYRERELSALLPPGRFDLLLVPDELRGFDHLALAQGVVADLGLALPIVAVGHDGFAPGTSSLPSPPSDVDEARWAFATSGSTGSPKAALHSDRGLLVAAHGFAQHGQLGREAGDLGAIPFPVAHIGGIQFLANVLLAGVPAVLIEVFTPQAVLAAFERFPITMIGGSPVFYQALWDLQRQSEVTLFPHLRLLKGGGAPLPEATYWEISKGLGVQVAHDYGMTEVAMVAVANPDDDPAVLALTDGTLIPGLECRTVDGELQLRGAPVTLGYTDPSRDAEVFTEDGWFRTGDLATVSAAGHVTVTGRLKDVIIRKGENIAPLEIEELMAGMPAVAEVSVVGLPDRERGELVCAAVRLVPGASLTLADVRAHLQGAGLMLQKVPERLELLDELPKTGLGKVSKQALQKQLS